MYYSIYKKIEIINSESISLFL